MKNKINRRNWLQLGLGAGLSSIGLKIFGFRSLKGQSEDCNLTRPETMGPFHPNKDQADKDFDLTLFNGSKQRAEGELIYVRGKVMDENCQAIPGAVVMIWQANKHGKYSHEYDKSDVKEDPNFQGWGQVLTNEKGEYGFKTIKPGAYALAPGSKNYRTPHIHFKISKRGYHELITQMYFEGEALNEKDIFAAYLSASEKAQVIRTALREVADIEKKASLYQFDLVLKAVRPLSKDLDQYTGEYAVDISSETMKSELKRFYGGSREELSLSLSVEDNRLFAEMPIQPKCEIFPLSKDRYSYRAFESEIEFIRNPDHQVIEVILHRNYGPVKIKAVKKN